MNEATSGTREDDRGALGNINGDFKMSMEHWRKCMDKESRSGGRKSCPSVILSTTNLTCNGLVKKRGLRSERPAINLLGSGAAYILKLT